MSYSKQTWGSGVAGGTPISATRLNNIENGLALAGQFLGTGTSFPATGIGIGDTYFHSGLGCLMRYNGVSWWQAEPSVVSNAAGRTAISTTYSSVLYAGFRVRQSDVGYIFEWNGTTWYKVPSNPNMLWTLTGSGSSTTVGVGQSGFNLLAAQGPVPAHSPGPLLLRGWGSWAASSNCAGYVQLGWSNTTTFTGLVGVEARIHNFASPYQVPWETEGYLNSDGAAKYIWVIGWCDAGSGAGVTLNTWNITVTQL